MKKIGILIIALIFATLSIGGPGGASAASARVSNARVPQDTSVNWSGYVADAGNSYTQVGASWIVPTPTPATTTATITSDAVWVGIGGVESRDLIQAGTQAVVKDGRVRYRAWYELLPSAQKQIPLEVRGGDSITVSLAETSKNIWHLSFINNTTGKSYVTDIAYKSSRSSAEWIAERPLFIEEGRGSFAELDHFGTINFTNAYTVASGNNKSLSEAGAHSIEMFSTRDEKLATPSAIVNADDFSITRSAAAAGKEQQTASRSRGVLRHSSGGRGFVITLPSGDNVHLRIELDR